MDKPQIYDVKQLINLYPNDDITLIKRKLFNAFLRIAKDEMIKGGQETNKEKIFWVKVPFSKLKELAFPDVKINEYDYIKEQIIGLMKLQVDTKNLGVVSFLSNLNKKDNMVEFSLGYKVSKLLQKSDFYTTNQIKNMATFDSKYSICLYEKAIKSLDGKRYKEVQEIPIDDIRFLTGTYSKYNRFSEFKKRVLEKPCQEISEKTDITMEYETIKSGRKIQYINIKFTKKERHKIKELKLNKKEFELIKEILWHHYDHDRWIIEDDDGFMLDQCASLMEKVFGKDIFKS